MAKRFECPRCGSGVRPSDTQCFRCGELLLEDAPSPRAPEQTLSVPEIQPAREEHIAGGSLKHVGTAKPHSTGIKQAPPVTRAVAEAPRPEKEKLLERKEREIEDREKAVVESVEQLEEDTRALEEALKRFEQEDALVRDREQALKDREAALESMAARMEEALGHLGEKSPVAGQLAEDAQRLKQISAEYSERIAEERRIQKKAMDREIEERMERLRTLQGLINAASAIPLEREEREHGLAVEELLRQEQEPKFDAAMVNKVLEEVTQEVAAEEAAPHKLDFEVISTHDSRLDQILGGGIPGGHVIIINGGPGTMKSTLTYYIMHNATTKAGKKGMYFSLEQKRDSIIRQMELMGLPRAPAEERMMVVDMVDLRKAMKDEKGDWRQIMMRYVKNVHEQMPFDLFVLDSLDSFKGIAQFDFTRQHMMELFDWFKSLNITVLVITEKPLAVLECSKQGETYLADGVIELLMKEFDDAKVHRWLRCLKMRGMQNDPRFYAFYHTGQEFKFSLPLVDSGH